MTELHTKEAPVYSKARYGRWLQRIGKVLLSLTSDEVLDSEEPAVIVANVHRMNELLKRLERWHKSSGIISWHR